MPKKEIYKVPVDKTIFMSVLKKCKYSIIKLGKNDKVECTERTIRRALNEGKMTPLYLDQIAKLLDVDTRLLSGELHKRAESYSDEFLKNIFLSQLTIEQYPYYRKRKEDLEKQPIEQLLEQILSLFEISIFQFEDLEFEAKYQLQHDLFDAISPVIRKHFEVDAYGRKDMPNLERIVNDLENYHEDYYQDLYAENILRKKFLDDPPLRKSKSEIRRMNTDELIFLDMEINNK